MALQVPEVTAFLRSRHVQVVDEWTVECLDWLQQEYRGQNVKPNEMKQYVYDQWLDSDLTEIASPALPPGIAQQRKTQLTGSYVLQINSVQDISTPAYGQLIKLQGKENENVLVTATQATQQTQSKFEQKSSRMLMLQLTDGHQSLEGMEYQPISQLSVNILPGTKILVHGSVQCRMGVLMLTANNVRVLGGDAESLAENNSQIQILSRALGLDGSQQSQQDPVPAISNQRQPTPQSPIDLTGDTNIGEINRNIGSSTGRSNHNKQRESHVNEEDGFFSDDLGEDLDALMLNEIQRIEEMDQIQQLASSAGEETEWPADEEEIDEMWLEQVEQNHGANSTDPPKQNATTKNKSNSAPVITRTAPNISTLNQAPPQSWQGQKDVKVKTEPFAARQGSVKLPTSGKINHSSVNSLTSVCHQDKMESKRPDQKGLGNDFKTNMPDSKGAFSRTKDEPSANRSTNVSSNTKIGNNPRTSEQHAHRDIPSKANLDSKKTLDYKVPTVPQFLKNKETAGPETKPLVDFQQKALSSEPSTSSSDPITNFLKLRTGVAKPAPATGIAARITKEPPQGKWDNNAKNSSSLAATAQSSTSGSEDTETSFEEGLSAAKRRRFRSNEGGWTDRGMASSSIVALSSVMGRIQAQDIFTFTIKGFVVTLISALSKKDGYWSISAKISDRSATLDVDLSNEVLTGLIGFSVTEMIQLKKTIKTSDPVKAKELETKLRQGLAQCQKSLISMHCTMTVQVRSNQERPLVIAVGKTDPADLATNFREVPSKS